MGNKIPTNRNDELTDESRSRQNVRLAEIPTWAEDFNRNRVELERNVAPADEQVRQLYAVDWEINNKVSLYEGDITCIEADGIVSCCGISLQPSGGVSLAIKKAAGSGLDDELAKLNGCQTGEAKTTAGHKLPAEYIIHTVGPVDKNQQLLDKCYTSCLEQMNLKQMKSLVFCCISTGAYGYPSEEAAQVALKRVRLWLEERKKRQALDQIDRIVFCLFTPKDMSAYKAWTQVYFPCGSEGISHTFQKMSALHTNDELTDVSHSRQNVRLAEIPTWAEICKMKREKLAKNVAPAESCKERLLQEKMVALEPLEGFIQITTTEPDMITFDDDPNSRRAKMPCGHVIGPESMTEYCRGILNQGKYVFPCPDPGCNAEWQYFLVRHVACLTPSEMQAFEKRISENYIKREENAQKCPGCNIYCTRMNKGNNCVECPFCSKKQGVQYFFCWKCLDTWKGGNTNICGNARCNEIDNRITILADCPNKLILDKFDAPGVRGCPKCGILIEYLSQCTQMYCCGCGHYFCFLCLDGAKTKQDLKCDPYESTCRIAPRQTELPGM